MTTVDQVRIIEIAMETNLFVAPRKASSPYDWGDQPTIGMQTKHHGATPSSPMDHFGTYLGYHGNVGYVIAIKDWKSNLVSGEIFESIDEMKQRWELD